MGHFRVELHAVEAFFFVGHNGERAGVGAGDGHEVGRDRGHFVAVAHPHVQQRFAGRADGVFDVAQQRALVDDFHLRVAELAFVGALHMATQLHRHGLHAVAHAQHRHAGVEHVVRGARAAGFGGAFRPPDRMMPLGLNSRICASLTSQAAQFAVNADFAHAAGDQLSVLRTEVQYEDAMLMDILCHVRRIPATREKERKCVFRDGA